MGKGVKRGAVRGSYQVRTTKIINGYKYETGMGCRHAPSCFACPFEDCEYDNSDSVSGRMWSKGFLPCLNVFNCCECKNRRCMNG